jgi:hypothetical protein
MEVDKTIETEHGTFHFRPYTDKDEEKVIELWEVAFQSKMDRRIWKWKFHDNPFGKQIMLCFTDEGLPIALFGGILFPANWNSKDIKITQLIDNMSHPNYRQVISGRKGLFAQNALHFWDVYLGPHASLLLYGFPGKKHFRLGNILLKYSKIGNEGVYLSVDIRKLKNSLIPALGQVDNPSAAAEDFDQLYEAAGPHYPFIANRSKQFINWRFFRHPINKYKVFTYKSIKGKMLAYAVLTNKNNIATVVDVFGLPRKTAFRALFQKIKKKLLSEGIPTMQIWLPKNHFITEYLIQFGFEEKEEPLGIIPTGRSFEEILDIDYVNHNIYYTMGDGDLF